MYELIAETTELISLRRLLGCFGGKLELAARFERPLEALADDLFRERVYHELRDRRDAERAWKVF